MPGQGEPMDLSPSEKPLLVSGPARVPEISDTSGVPFPNLRKILSDHL